MLIKDGAKLVQEAIDAIEELPLDVRQRLKPRMSKAAAAAVGGGANASPDMVNQASPVGKKVFSLLRVDVGMHIDEIIRECDDETSPAVLAALSELELYGVVRQLPGKNFVRTWND